MGDAEISCMMCGVVFTPLSGNQRCCASCKKAAKKKYQHEWYTRRNPVNRTMHYNTGENAVKTKPFVSTMNQLTKDTVDAKNMGVTYGQYIAFYKGRRRRKG